MGSLQSQNWMKFLKIFEGPLEKYVANFGEKGFFLLLLFTDGLHTSLLDPGVPGVLWVWMSISVDLTDVTLADEDTNPIPTDNANRAIQGNVVTLVFILSVFKKDKFYTASQSMGRHVNFFLSYMESGPGGIF